MNVNTGYQITNKIYESASSLVYRAIRNQDNQAIILKILKEDYPTPSELTKYKQEYTITRSINLDGVIKAYDLHRYQNSLVILLEDFGGESLKIWMAEHKFTLEEFFCIAIKITESLGTIHAAHIIHKDINPSNIVYNPKTGQLKIIDFGIATVLSRENPVIRNPNLLEGTLAYISPEQTGRMNRVIDYRSDFYSLGVTFYELLTNQLPFDTTDAIELVHCHIAKQPVPPHILNAEIPLAVSNIVTKLLAKTAEERYQSTWGIKADLEACVHQLQTSGQIEDFPLGYQDISDKFQITQKLYGREEEVAQLLTTFERVCQGTTEIMLVAGYSGIGKSALVNEVHKPIVQQRGYVISGKCDQFERNTPYTSFIQAFQDLIRQLLTESEAQIQTWKKKILEALGTNGQVIIDVIPEVELIIGEQPSVPQLGATESQNRFNLVFQKFIGVFTKKEHPLVLFLDDLQWADSASLKLVEILMTNTESQYLLMIGAYRDNEVNASHYLMLIYKRLQEMGIKVNHITLQPLAIEHIKQLIADTLNCSTQQSKPLAELIFHKTNGNPFFLTQLLQSLYADNLLLFNFSTGSWQWDIEQIQAVEITDNVVELMVKKIEKLDEQTQNILKLAACIGNRFDLKVLSVVNEKSLTETATDLWSALQEGLIVPLSDAYTISIAWNQEKRFISKAETLQDVILQFPHVIRYKFLHDRVQQAAYVLIPKNTKKEVHLKIGRLLQSDTQPDELEENIFDIVNQLNHGAELITNQSERYILAQLNLIAGKKAKVSTAYEPALQYFKIGLELLTSESWYEQYELALALHTEAVETEFLNTHFEEAEQLSSIVLQKGKTLLDTLKIYEIKIQYFLSHNQFQEAIDIALPILEKLGVCLSKPSVKPKNLVGNLRRKLTLANQQIEDLVDLQTMTEPYKLAALRILTTFTPAMYITNSKLLPIVIFTMVDLCIKYGNSSLAAVSYAWLGSYLCGVMGDINFGYRFSQLSLKLLDKFGASEFTAKVYHLFYSLVSHWKDHVREAMEPFLEGVHYGIETGDVEWSCYLAISYCRESFFAGDNLSIVQAKYTRYIDLMIGFKQEYSFLYINICRQIVVNLLGQSEEKFRFLSKDCNEEKFLPILINTNNGCTLIAFYLAKAIILYLFKDYNKAAENTKLGEKYEQNAFGMMVVSVNNFYYSLALLALYPNSEENDKKEYLKKVILNQKKMKHWASNAPANYQHKYELVEAEKARVLKKKNRAMEYYDRAIQGARKYEYLHEEAIAYERAAEFYFSIGREEIAQLYIKNAHHCYVRWGATAKVKDLESEYPYLLVGATNRTDVEGKNTISSSTGSDPEVLDLATVIKASQTLADEIVLDKLLKKLMKIVIENAGAQTGYLLLERQGHWVIEAEGTVNSDDVTTLQSLPVNSLTVENQIPILSTAIINYVARTQENVVLNDASKEGQFTRDRYIIATQPKSILCTPLLYQGKFSGILYLENNLTTGAFTSDRVEVLKILSAQAAISIENSRLYEQLEDYSRTLEQKVEVRTQELQEKNYELASILEKLKATQAQIIAQEKLASLGALTAGIAHEIKNPLNFVNNFAELSVELTQELLTEIENQKDHLDPESTEYIEEILNDLSQNAQKINEHGKRADNIVRGMLMHSRGQTCDERQLTNINALLAEAVSLTYHGMRAKETSFDITVETDYDDSISQINVVAQNMSRALINVINNACYAAHNKAMRFKAPSGKEREKFSPTLSLKTKNLGECVEISIRDNGDGIPQETLDKIFHPFFTTKPPGEGTGLGLSITHDIIVQQHQGGIRVDTQVGSFAEFIITLPKSLQKKTKI